MEIIKKHRAYFALYFPFLILVGYVVFAYSKSSIHIYVNQFHSPFFDWFFKYLTYLGDGWPIAFIAVFYLLFISIRQGFLIGFSALFASAITQVFKHFVFGGTLRPGPYFKDVEPYALHLVEGVDLHSAYSLPSGHTTAAFALTISIAFIYNTRKMDTFMFIIGVLIGWSRVYLSQHFLEDVFMGSIVGVLGTIVIYSLLYSDKMLAKHRLDRPLINWKKMSEQEKYMQQAIDLSRESVKTGGGPFGAVIVKNGQIIAEASNSVTKENDPTGHAEINAIRKAAKVLQNFDLTGCEIYSSCEPCPMCLGAIYWARLDKLYFANTKADAAKINFDDQFIYEEIEKPFAERKLITRQMMRDKAILAFKDWEDMEGKTRY